MKRYKEIILVILLFFTYSINNQGFSQIESSDNKNDTIFISVKTAPSFPGGDDARINYFKKNIVYPKKAIRKNIEGTVFVTFVVEIDGKISNAKILKGIGGGCDEEAIRLINNMPKWIAGEQNEKKVRVQYSMPIRFKLTGKL